MRAEKLFAPLKKENAAIKTGARLGVSYTAMPFRNRTGTAKAAPPGRFAPAISTVFRKLCGCVQLTPVDGLMTRDANSDSVCHVNNSFGMLGNGFNMMGVELPAIPALLTLEAVPLKNCRAPFGRVTSGKCSVPMQTMTALPRSGLFSDAGISGARARAELGGFVAACKRMSAPCTKFFNRRIPMRPAHLTTIPGRFGAICLDMVRQSTNFASLYFAGVFHDLIMPCNKDKCKLFIARMTDAFPGIEIRRIKP
ncbi:MAG: hypothetical protein ABH845_04960 [Candidatus Omnitrophota bacterium]